MNLNNVSSSTALALSDGTAVDFVKITSKDNIQVRVPTDHPTLGSDPLRIFRRDGSHYKDAFDLKLVIKEAAADGAPAPTPAADAPAPTSTVSAYEVNGSTFDTLADAQQEAKDLFFDGETLVEIFAIERKLVGKIGFIAA